MTISNTASTVTIAGNGVTTTFNFSFVAGTASNIVVTYTNAAGVGTVLQQGSQYTLTLNAPAAGQIWGVGGSVVYSLSGSPIAAGTYLTISRIVPDTQLISISNQGDFYPQVVEKALDTLEMQIQQDATNLSRAITINPADTVLPNPLPPAGVRANQYLIFDSNGQPTAGTAISGTLATNFSNIAALRANPSHPTIAIAWVAGYYTGADGGEGMFWFNAFDTTSTDNGGTIIVDAAGNRWYRETGGDQVSVAMFGALGANADYTTAIQSAYTYASSLPSGCIVQWPAGIYGVSAAIAITGDNISSVGGPGRGSVRIMLLSATANLFDVGGSGVSFSGFTIDGHLTYTAGILFNYWGGPSGNGGGGAGLEDITSIAGFRVAEFTGNLAANIFIDNCIFDNCASNGIYFGPRCGGFVQVSNVQMDTPESINATGVGITMQAGGTYLFNNVNVSGFYTAWRISTVAGTTLTDIYCVNCLGDGTVGVRRVNGTYGWDIDGSGGGFGSLGRIGLVNCWAGSMPSDGFSIQVAYDVSLTDARAYGNSGHGIHLKSANSIDAVVITAAKCGSNSWLSPGTYNGIQVDNQIGGFQINGGWFAPMGNLPNNQAYGIAITGTSHDNYSVIGTYTGGNLSGGLLDQGTGPTKAVANNL